MKYRYETLRDKKKSDFKHKTKFTITPALQLTKYRAGAIPYHRLTKGTQLKYLKHNEAPKKTGTGMTNSNFLSPLCDPIPQLQHGIL